MKYYVVSESELEDLVTESRYFEAGNVIERTDILYRILCQAEAACRVREVRFIGAADQGSSLMLWGEVKK